MVYFFLFVLVILQIVHYYSYTSAKVSAATCIGTQSLVPASLRGESPYARELSLDYPSVLGLHHGLSNLAKLVLRGERPGRMDGRILDAGISPIKNEDHGKKTPQRRHTKSPARFNKSKSKQSQGRQVPPPEPRWQEDYVEPSSATASSAAAEAAMQELMTSVQQMDQLTPDVQRALQKAQKATLVEPARQLESAASRLRNARDQLRKAREARKKMHASWAAFIAEAVKRWNQHSEDFATKDAEHMTAIQDAMDRYQMAKRVMESSKEAVNAEDAPEENADQNDEELMTDDPPNIKDDLQAMTQSFERIRARQEDIVEDAPTKKARVEEIEIADKPMPGARSMQPFGRGGS
eukprot:s2911_g4.t1